MEQTEIYSSEGNRVDSQLTPGETNERVSELFFGNVRLAVDFTKYSAEAWVFFWARDDLSSRPNQFYAKYETDQYSNFFNQLKSAVRDRVENDLQMHLVTGKEAVEVFEKLDQGPTNLLKDSEKSRLKELYSENQNLDFGTNSYSKALDICKLYFNSVGSGKFAISGNGRFENLSGFDLVVDYGSEYDGIEAIGATKDLEERKLEQMRDQHIRNSLNTIETEIERLQSDLDLSAQEIHDRLENRVPSVFRRSRSGANRESGTDRSVHSGATDFPQSENSQDQALTGLDGDFQLILRLVLAAGVIGLLFVILALLPISPLSMVTGLLENLIDVLAIALLVAAIALYLAKIGFRLPTSGSSSQGYNTGQANLKRTRSSIPLPVKIVFVLGIVSIIILGAYLVAIMGGFSLLGGGQNGTISEEPSDLVIHAPGNNTTIDATPLSLDGTTVAPQIEIVVHHTDDITDADGPTKKERIYFNRFETDIGDANRTNFTRSIPLDSERSGKYRITIKNLNNDDKVMQSKRIWIDYDPGG